jgi:hypothetical protein
LLEISFNEATGTYFKAWRKRWELVVAELDGRVCPHPALAIDDQSPSKPRTVFFEAAAFFVYFSVPKVFWVILLREGGDIGSQLKWRSLG